MKINNVGDENIIATFIKCRSLIGSKVKKTLENKHLKSSYANLESVTDVLEEALKTCNLYPIQNAVTSEDARLVTVNTILLHETGSTLEFDTVLPLGKMDAQGFGSTFTYGRRYSLLGIFGLVPADDDGNKAGKTTNDVKLALAKEPDADARKNILAWAIKLFAGDEAKIQQCQAHYDRIEAEIKTRESKGFVPVPSKSKNKSASEEPVAIIEQAEEEKTPPVDGEDPNMTF